MKFSTGRVISYRPLANGAREAIASPGPEEMTEPEWQEFCKLTVLRAKQDARNARRRAFDFNPQFPLDPHGEN